MTDREMLLHLIGKLGLKAAPDRFPDPDEYEVDGAEIVIGSGRGQVDQYVVFRFDDDGNLVDHAARSLP